MTATTCIQTTARGQRCRFPAVATVIDRYGAHGPFCTRHANERVDTAHRVGRTATALRIGAVML